MTTFGRMLVTVLVAVLLVGVTIIAGHYLRAPEPAVPGLPEPSAEREPAPREPEAPPVVSEPAPTEHAPAEAPPGPEAPSPTEPEPSGPGAALADEGLALVAEGRKLDAQKVLSEALRTGVSGARGREARDALNRLGEAIQLSWRREPADPQAKVYVVEPGDTLIGIGQRFLIPYQLVMRLNRLTSDRINAGQNLKVLQGPIDVEVVKSAFEVRAWLGEVCVQVWPAGVGANNSTPEGVFVVQKKIRNPPYQPQHRPPEDFRPAGHPENPLGTRWIDIGNHYGLHGTVEPESIGRPVSEGCIRMHNRDVEQLYDLVVSGATKVTVRP